MKVIYFDSFNQFEQEVKIHMINFIRSITFFLKIKEIIRTFEIYTDAICAKWRAFVMYGIKN